jgi:ISXO2-like transposase domain
MPLDTRPLFFAFHRLIANRVPIECKNCLGTVKPSSSALYSYKCTTKKCRKQMSLLFNTPFYHLKISVEDALTVLKFWLCNVSTTAIAELLGYERSNISRFLKKCYKLMIARFEPSFTKIGGENIVVEIDESKFRKNKYQRGRIIKGVWIFGMVERTPMRRIVLVPVDMRDKRTLEDILKTYVHEKSIIHSDCWKAYNNLKKEFAAHYTVNHSKFFKDPATEIHTNTIEGNWSAIKRQTPPNHRCKKSVRAYLIKYMLKRNYGANVFENLLNLLL